MLKCFGMMLGYSLLSQFSPTNTRPHIKLTLHVLSLPFLPSFLLGFSSLGVAFCAGLAAGGLLITGGLVAEGPLVSCTILAGSGTCLTDKQIKTILVHLNMRQIV